MDFLKLTSHFRIASQQSHRQLSQLKLRRRKWSPPDWSMSNLTPFRLSSLPQTSERPFRSRLNNRSKWLNLTKKTLRCSSPSRFLNNLQPSRRQCNLHLSSKWTHRLWSRKHCCQSRHLSWCRRSWRETLRWSSLRTLSHRRSWANLRWQGFRRSNRIDW